MRKKIVKNGGRRVGNISLTTRLKRAFRKSKAKRLAKKTGSKSWTVYIERKDTGEISRVFDTPVSSTKAGAIRQAKKLFGGGRNVIYTAVQNSQNPHGFVVIDQHGNKIASGKDYDKLQDKVDRHNEESDNQWFVIDESDYKEMSKQSKRNPNPAEVDRDAARELVLYIENDNQLYHQQGLPIIKNLIAKKARGTYRHDLAVKLYMHLMESGAKKYVRENGSSGDKWNDIFNKPTRELAAKDFVDSFESEAELGNYDYLLPKRYQKKNPNTGEVANVSMGYYDSTGFHPIRASHDYDEDLVDEHYRKRPVKKYARKEKAFKSKQNNPQNSTKSYIGKVVADKGQLLIGGVRFIKSARFESQVDAENWVNSQVDANTGKVREAYIVESKLKPEIMRSNPQRNPKAGQYYVFLTEHGNPYYFATRSEAVKFIKEKGKDEPNVTLQKTMVVRPYRGGGLDLDFKWEYFSYGKKVKSSKKNPQNPSGEVFNTDKIDELSGIFQGRINGKSIKTVGSDYTPPLTARLGKLAYLKLRNGKHVYEIQFDANGDAWLSADARKNLYLEGKDARIANVAKPKRGNLTWLGEVDQINYRTNKTHIENGQLVEYYHELGEVDGIKPNAFIDHDGFILLQGGNHDIGIHGIEN